jgi:hypothetical protein
MSPLYILTKDPKRPFVFHLSYFSKLNHFEELHGPAVSVPRRAIAKVKQRWSIIG